MGNRKNRRRSRRIESQSSDRDEIISDTNLTQGNATLNNVSENIDNILDRNLGSEITEPSQIGKEIDVISQRLAEQNNTKMTQNDEQLNSKFEEILNENRVNRNNYIVSDYEDAENNRPSPSNLENRTLRKKHASNIAIDKDKNQDDRFESLEMNELRQPYTPLGVVNETLDETVIINENKPEVDHHSRITMKLSLFELELKIFPLLHRRDHFVFARKFLK